MRRNCKESIQGQTHIVTFGGTEMHQRHVQNEDCALLSKGHSLRMPLVTSHPFQVSKLYHLYNHKVLYDKAVVMANGRSSRLLPACTKIVGMSDTPGGYSLLFVKCKSFKQQLTVTFPLLLLVYQQCSVCLKQCRRVLNNRVVWFMQWLVMLVFRWDMNAGPPDGSGALHHMLGSSDNDTGSFSTLSVR